MAIENYLFFEELEEDDDLDEFEFDEDDEPWFDLELELDDFLPPLLPLLFGIVASFV